MSVSLSTTAPLGSPIGLPSTPDEGEQKNYGDRVRRDEAGHFVPEVAGMRIAS
jgi:hypothetical protein